MRVEGPGSQVGPPEAECTTAVRPAVVRSPAEPPAAVAISGVPLNAEDPPGRVFCSGPSQQREPGGRKVEGCEVE
jgi:hypothetical protein